MKIATFLIKPIQENTYFYYNEKTLEGVIIDPGGDFTRLIRFIDENELDIKSILLTHGHFDHILAAEQLQKELSIPIVAHKDEFPVLTDGRINMSSQMSKKTVYISPDVFVTDNDIIGIGQDKLIVIHTPGHTPGGVCYYSQNDKVLFTGDTLFYESVGRTDFAMGSTKMLYESIEKKLLTLPADVSIYPGHGPASSIGHERHNNPFFYKEVIG